MIPGTLRDGRFLMHPPDRVPVSPGPVLSLVADDGRSPIRRVPVLYFGRAPVFGHRDVQVVAGRLPHLVDSILRAIEIPTFALIACELAGHRGVLAGDLYNRSRFRRRLAQSGLRMEDDPFLYLTAEGTLQSTAGSSFSPSFFVYEERAADAPAIVRPSRAWVVYGFASTRVGATRAQDLRSLSRIATDLVALGSVDPSHLVRSLTKALEGC